MKIELTLKYERMQYLGMVNNKPIRIDQNKKVQLSEDDWNKIKDRKWNKKLIEEKLLEVKYIEKNKKIEKMEKEIEEGKIEIDD